MSNFRGCSGTIYVSKIRLLASTGEAAESVTSKLEEISTHLGGLDELWGRGEVGDQIWSPIDTVDGDPILANQVYRYHKWYHICYMFIISSFGDFFLKPHRRSCRILSQEYDVGFPGRGAYCWNCMRMLVHES